MPKIALQTMRATYGMHKMMKSAHMRSRDFKDFVIQLIS